MVLHPTRKWAEQRETDSPVVRARKHDECRLPPSLLVPRLRIEMPLHDIAVLRQVGFDHYQISRSTGRPVSTSECTLRRNSSQQRGSPPSVFSGYTLGRVAPSINFGVGPCCSRPVSAAPTGCPGRRPLQSLFGRVVYSPRCVESSVVGRRRCLNFLPSDLGQSRVHRRHRWLRWPLPVRTAACRCKCTHIRRP